MEIVTQDVWVQAKPLISGEVGSQIWWIEIDGEEMTSNIPIEKKENMVVLTKEQFEKEVSDRVQAALSILNVKPQLLPNI